jgi:aspartate racemase
MHGHNFADYVKCIDAKDWAGVAELMLSSSEKLAKAGADFLIAPVNTVHQAFDLVAHRSPRPWLHIAVEMRMRPSGMATAPESSARASKMRKVPLSRHAECRGIEHRVPGGEQRERMHRYIFDELVHGNFQPRTQAYFTEIIRALKDEGCDAVALACTEIPLLLTQEQSPLPMLDSTRILARAALRKAIEG